MTAAGLLSAGLASASVVPESASLRIPVYFIFENFYWTRPGKEGATNRVSWIYGEAQLAPSIKAVGSYLDLPTPNKVLRILDEGFLEWSDPARVVRVGRLRARFGLGDWSELFYTPIAQFAMVRANPINSLALLRFDTGVDMQANVGNLQYQVGLLDVKSEGWQLTPRYLDHAVARVQGTVGGFVIGANGLTRFKSGSNRNTMVGLDVRWSTPGWIVRAEFVKGLDKGANGEGGYLDVFYRPEKWYRTQFGLRSEFYKKPGTAQSLGLETLGVRQILSKEFALTVNYGWGSRTVPAGSMRGWTMQFMSAVRF